LRNDRQPSFTGEINDSIQSFRLTISHTRFRSGISLSPSTEFIMQAFSMDLGSTLARRSARVSDFREFVTTAVPSAAVDKARPAEDSYLVPAIVPKRCVFARFGHFGMIRIIKLWTRREVKEQIPH
jgi:hypothetical protein